MSPWLYFLIIGGISGGWLLLSINSLSIGRGKKIRIIAFILITGLAFAWFESSRTTLNSNQVDLLEQMIAKMEDTVQTNPQDINAWRLLRKLYLNAEDLPQALTASKKIIDADVAQGEDLLAHLQLLQLQDKHEQAQEIAKKILTLPDPTLHAYPYWYLHLQARNSGDLEAAKSLLEKAKVADQPGILTEQIQADEKQLKELMQLQAPPDSSDPN